MAATREYLLPAAAPHSPAEFAALLRAVLTHDGLLSAHQAETVGIEIDANEDASEISRLELTASGLQLAAATVLESAGRHEAAVPAVAPEPLVATEVTVARAGFTADPVLVEGVPVRAGGTATDVRFAWDEDADGGLWVRLLEAAPGKPADASFFATVDVCEVEPLVAAVVSRVDPRAKVLEFVPEITTPTDRSMRVHAQVKCAYGILRAALTVDAAVHIDDELVLHVDSVHLGSRNPLMALVYGAAERVLSRSGRIPERVDLNGQLPIGLVLEDARLHAEGSVVTFSGKVRASAA